MSIVLESYFGEKNSKQRLKSPIYYIKSPNYEDKDQIMRLKM